MAERIRSQRDLHVLAGEQHRFALGDEHARRFPPALAPFAGRAGRSPAAFDA